MYFQGLFNQVVYWPTYTWSYLHVVLASIFICMWKNIREGYVDDALYDDEPSEDYFEENTFNDEEEFEDFSDTASP